MSVQIIQSVLYLYNVGIFKTDIMHSKEPDKTVEMRNMVDLLTVRIWKNTGLTSLLDLDI